MITSLPNLLTLSRIGVIPAIVALFWFDGDVARWVMLALFTLALGIVPGPFIDFIRVCIPDWLA